MSLHLIGITTIIAAVKGGGTGFVEWRTRLKVLDQIGIAEKPSKCDDIRAFLAHCRTGYNEVIACCSPPKGLTGLAGSCDEVAGGTIAQSTVGMHLVLMGDPAWQLVTFGSSIRPGAYPDIVAFKGATECLCHTVRLWAADRGRKRHQADDCERSCGCRAQCSSCRYR